MKRILGWALIILPFATVIFGVPLLVHGLKGVMLMGIIVGTLALLGGSIFLGMKLSGWFK